MWHKIYLNKQNIQTETSLATLIKMPHSSNYDGWLFWHPNKLIKEEGGKGYHLSFSFSEEWTFKIFKQYKKGKSPEKVISITDMKEAFNQSNESIEDSLDAEKSSYLHVTEPTPIDKEIEVNESLRR